MSTFMPSSDAYVTIFYVYSLYVFFYILLHCIFVTFFVCISVTIVGTAVFATIYVDYGDARN